MSADLLDRLIEDIAGDVAALTIHAHNELGARVARPMPTQPWVGGSLDDRLSMIVFAVRQLRCDGCARFATHGRLCATCHAGVTAEGTP